jgi:DNA-binding HxlR family transcriptional regulator
VSSRSYGQYCAVATALDAIGDRWALLVIRELLSGPKRYTDLRDGLPGIPTDVLAARLRGLEDEGVVKREVLAPPAASKVYALTAHGAELEPVLVALARWGTARLPSTQNGEFRPHWLIVSLRSMFVPAAAANLRLAVDFRVGGGHLRASIDRSTLQFDQHPSGPADVVISGDPAAIASLAGDRPNRRRALSDGRVVVEGKPDAIMALQRAFGLEP